MGNEQHGKPWPQAAAMMSAFFECALLLATLMRAFHEIAI